ncbi:MAG: pseudaminic acid cytidylyltransferase [Rhodospirillaceae bacterium]|nr:pseudaminic acid cytidylyltransferase [Rhodospirillaceae bacterium]
MQSKLTRNSLAVIPARAGSKRIPEKNIRLFHGKPVITYAIHTAINSGLFEKIIVSTDSEKIAEIAIKEGAEVPFIRPSFISDDHATTAEVLNHDLIKNNATDCFEFACCIYPVTPFLTISDLENGFQLLNTKDAKSTFGATEFNTPISRAFNECPEGKMKMLWPHHSVSRTQDLQHSFYDSGQFYWIKVDEFIKKPELFTDNTYAIKIPNWRSHDIDTEDDWQRAELIYRALQMEKI